MKSHPIVWQETAAVALGQLVCCAATLGVYALLDKFSTAVLLGALAGAVLATGNFFAMAMAADMAADKVQAGEAANPASLQLSYLGRMITLFVILVACAKSGLFDLIALVLPLVFVRPILGIKALLFNKKEAAA